MNTLFLILELKCFFFLPRGTLGCEFSKKTLTLHVTLVVAMETAAILDFGTTILVRKFLSHIKSYFHQTNSNRQRMTPSIPLQKLFLNFTWEVGQVRSKVTNLAKKCAFSHVIAR